MATMHQLSQKISNIPLGYFSMVMSTGIISIAAYLLDYQLIAEILYFANIAFLVSLSLVLLYQLISCREKLHKELTSHKTGPGALTIVAGMAVLGGQQLLMGQHLFIASVLFIIATILWLILSYGLLLIFTIKAEKQPLAEGIGGNWLLFIVATQSIAILGTYLVPEQFSYLLLPFTLILFISGIILYIPIITFIFYRFTFLPINVKEMRPPYWINMGALAISTYAACTLISNADQWKFLQEIKEPLEYIAFVLWAFCVWWLPFIFLMGVWRHLLKRYPLKYEYGYWSMVFPLGMFTVCSVEIIPLLGIEMLSVVPQVFFIIAVVAWCSTFTGLLLHLLRGGKNEE